MLNVGSGHALGICLRYDLQPEPKHSGSIYKIEPAITGFCLTRFVGRTPIL